MTPSLRALLIPLLCAAALAVAGDAPAETASEAQLSLEQQYQKSPNPEFLYKLGMLAAEQGRAADALDFLRRYLTDPQTPVDSPAVREAQRKKSELHATAGELLVSGDKGALVLVDGRLRGILPLTLPLFLTAGEHTVVVRSSSRLQHSQINIEHGRRIEARFESSSRAVVVSSPPPVAVLLDAPALPPAIGRKLGYTIDLSVTRAGLAPFLPEVALARVGPECRGATTLRCQEQLAKNSNLDFVLSVKLAAPAAPRGGGWTVAVELLDSHVEDLAAAETRTLDLEAAAGLSELAELIDRVLLSGTGRSRGTLRVDSTPAGAEVYARDRSLGVTPLKRTVWTGQLDLELRLRGFRAESRQVTIGEQQPAELVVPLQPLPASVLRRPAWRVGVGLGALTGGALMVGFGGAAIAIDGQCVSDPVPPLGVCPNLFDTQTPGAVLVGVGAGLTVAGVLLIAWPPRSASPQAADGKSASP